MSSPVPTAKQQRALVRAKRLYSSRAGIRGVDLGYLYRAGRRARTLGIRFHLERKKAPSNVTGAELLPKEIDGIPCDVVEASYMPHANINPRDEIDPVCAGISVGNLPRRTAGTLGAFVAERHSGTIAVLSNWHVLVGSSDALSDEPIIQPAGNFLGPNPARPMATLTRWLDLDNGYDAAIATVAEEVELANHQANLDLAIAEVAEPQLGMRLVKSASISGVTHGIVDGVAGSYPINYERFGGGTRWMQGIRIVPDPDDPVSEVSLSGDSGAVWIDRDSGRAVALHFGGEDHLTPLYEYALAHPLQAVLDQLNVDLLTGN